MSAVPVRATFERIDYPESDGKPLGETDAHRREILAIIFMLEEYFAADSNVYVSGNLMLYYEQGNPSAVVSPDVFVVKGVPKQERRIYKLWEEGRPPVSVFEITSRSTRLEDKGSKRELFAELGVREYFLFDPLAEYLKPPLQGFELQGDEFVALEPGADESLVSQELGLRLHRDGSYLRLINLASGQALLRAPELEAARRAAEERTRSADTARRAAEERTRSADTARRAAEQRAQSAEEELERLRAELARLRGEQ
jgi:Uma2 family endonuclease